MKTKTLLIAIAALFIAIPIAAQAVYSLPKLGAQPPQILTQILTPSRQNLNEPFCYFKTEGGKTIDLTLLCGQASRTPGMPAISYPDPPTVYNRDTLNDFDRSLYGS
jgi:hypothetical protein